jgi:hypothetical protein
MRTLIGVAMLTLPLVAWAAAPPRVEVVGRAELPPRVEAAFARQAGNRGIENLRRVEDAHGHTTYSAHVADTGHIVRVDSSGKILSP